MARKRTQKTETDDDVEKCPKCGSDDVAGLVMAFYVPMKNQFDATWQSESEIGPERYCGNCDHEWGSDQ